jgi:predicted dehydrogenase
MTGRQMETNETLSRRDLLKQASALTLVMALNAEEGQGAPEPTPSPTGPPVCFGVIGLGPQGRELLATLARLPGAPVQAICDTYAPFLKRGAEIAPKAVQSPDYHALLDNREVQAVLVATPSHQHRQIVLDALSAGKHVYCEAPLAVTVEDCRAMAQAAAGVKTIFQVGQQWRADPQHHHALKFARTGVLAKVAQARAQWHRKESWRRAAPTPERERALNWRLSHESSAGLMGEVGVHQVDVVSWFLKGLPTAVTGFGGILAWQDGREVADTVQCLFEYPSGVRLLYDATLANSFDGAYELLMGSDSALLLRGDRAWMFKEADSPLLGWEVYARKEKFGDDTGIALVANATQLLAQGKTPGQEAITPDATKTPFYAALEEFITCIRQGKKPSCGALEGLQAAVVAIKANDAIKSGARVAFKPEWFQL